MRLIHLPSPFKTPSFNPSMADESQKQQQLHVAMFPFLAFGHMIPYLEVAKLIAHKGHRVSYISTPKNIQRLLNNNTSLSPLIQFISFPLPPQQNLPPNIESTMDAPPDIFPFLKLAYDALQDTLSDFLCLTFPDWIIYDFASYWLPDIAARLGLSRAFLCPFPSYSVSLFGSTDMLITGDDPRGELPENYTQPPKWIPFSTTVILKHHESRHAIPFLRQKPNGNVSDLFRLGMGIQGCDVYLARATNELESQWLDVLRSLHNRPVLPIGLLPISCEDTTTEDATWPEIEAWLRKKDVGSVLYVALGSEARLNESELAELAHGLDLCGLPFFWALRQESELLPDGFEKRVSGRGIVCTRWAPQIRLLGHESVGGFLSHCGWTSTREALEFGLPLVMLPLFGDQPMIARVMRDELKVGVEIHREEDGSFILESVADSVKLIMKAEEGKCYREKAREMQKIYGNKELQDNYTDEFVEYLIMHRPNHTITPLTVD